MSRLAPLVFATMLCWALPLPARAQEAASDSPAHISVVDGAAVLERDGRTETAPISMPLLAGDRVRTQNGRVEILYADGSALHLDVNTVVDFQSDEVVRLLDGRVRLNIGGPRRRIDYRVDAPSAWVQVASPGEYRISVIASEREPEVELAVLRGAADLVNEDGRTSLAAGERAFARAGGAPSTSYVYNSAAWDAFDRWSEGRRDLRMSAAPSVDYLPEEVQPYAPTFSSYGYWQNVPTYGYVWYPRVHPGWRPYYNGYWSSFRPWGWTWIGSDPWAWPTHHYGRWGFNAGSWFWIPGRVWGPAWVSWAYAPSYVSWCPLGWNNRAVFAFNVNVHNGSHYNPWNAWTVVPHQGFGRGFVNANVVNASHIDMRTRSSFVVRDTAPDVRGYAVPRATAPIRVAGTRPAAAGGTAFSRSPSPGVTASAPSGSDAAATFRNRRSPSAPLNTQSYPAPAREPRDISSIPAPTRQAAPRTRAGAGVVASSPDVQSGVRSDVRSPSERRAVPRQERPAEMSSSWPSPSPSPSPMYSPSPSYGAPRERSPYRGVPSAEAPDPSQRAVPRSAPSGGVPDGNYRSRPGPEHSAPPPSSPGPSSTGPRSSAPSGPPPSAAPPAQQSGPSGPPPAASSGGESRSRSAAPSSGHAMPRGGGRGGR